VIYTYAILEVSERTYGEVRRLLEQAGHRQAIHQASDGEVLDMHGLALQSSVTGPRDRATLGSIRQKNARTLEPPRCRARSSRGHRD